MEADPATLTVVIDREEDGRWIAEVPALPGVLVYGTTQRDATNAALTLARAVVADRAQHGEL